MQLFSKGWSADGAYVVDVTEQLYVFCPLSRTLSASGSTPDSQSTHFDVELR